MKRFLAGCLGGAAAGGIAAAFHLAPVWAAALGMCVAVIIWAQLYEVVGDVIEDILD